MPTLRYYVSLPYFDADADMLLRRHAFAFLSLSAATLFLFAYHACASKISFSLIRLSLSSVFLPTLIFLSLPFRLVDAAVTARYYAILLL